jgi:glycosidase
MSRGQALVGSRRRISGASPFVPGFGWGRGWRPPGVLRRLGYLAELGVDAFWLSPIYPSPNVDLGYDVSDHTNVHPEMGSLTDFDEAAVARP